MPWAFACVDHAVDGGEKRRVREAAGNAEEVAQVEMPDPERIDVRNRGDRFHIGEAVVGLDLCNHHRSRMDRGDLALDVAPFVVVVREAERSTTPPGWRIARARHDVPGLLGRPDHRHHHAEGADIQRAGDEMVFTARHANHRDDPQTPAQRGLRFQRLEAESRVLHVEQHVLGARIAAQLRQAGREELEDHRAESRAAGGERLLDRIAANHAEPLFSSST